MLVQLAAVVLLAVGAYRFAQLWVDERAASYAGVLAVFAGSHRVPSLFRRAVADNDVGAFVFSELALSLRVVQVGQLAIAAERSCAHPGRRIGASRDADLRIRAVCPAGVVAGVV